jgi:hypothetical protein
LANIRIITEVSRTTTYPGVNMKKLLITAALVFASQFAFAQAAAPAGDCEAKAVSKKTGKPLAGAAKTTFMKKCMADAGGAPAAAGAPATSGCAEKAVSKSGKPLAGAAKNAFIKKCEKDAAAAGK